MNKTYIIIGGSVGGLSIVGILIFIFGWCVVTYCETQVEITSFETPEILSEGQKFQADFVIMNKGNKTAENCILRWYNPDFTYEDLNSDPFSLEPKEEIEIHLQSSSGAEVKPRACLARSTFDLDTDAWVYCDNTDSGRIRNTILFQCP